MRIPTVGWAFFGVVVLVLVGYVLNRGIFIGSDIRQVSFKMNDGTLSPKHVKHCKYLHFTGVRDNALWGTDTFEEENRMLCRMFDE
jgi:hypothetical protein